LRKGTAALPYTEVSDFEHGFEIEKTKPRADTAVRPYWEDLEIEGFRVIGIPVLV
jgi:hypothetical protein